jgi:NAD(P)-dependent dehydrogenase (short-subunit alcohol dehydrogenase family)
MEEEGMSKRFEGRIAFVTGGAQGIGAGVAKRLAQEGAAVAVADLSLEGAERTVHEIQENGGTARAYQVNVSFPEEIERAVDRTEKDLGTPSLVVPCAGIILTHPFLELSEQDWDRTIDINLKGTFFTMQSAASRMVTAGMRGSMVGISSGAGRSGRPNNVDYAASKAGVISLVCSAALALASHGITANAVCPGVVETPMTESLHEARSRILGITPGESLASMKEKIPLGRIATVDDVTNAIVFLLSDEGSYITGQAINIDGGMEFD